MIRSDGSSAAAWEAGGAVEGFGEAGAGEALRWEWVWVGVPAVTNATAKGAAGSGKDST